MLVANQGISWAHLALSLNVQKAKQIILGIKADTLSLFLVKTYIFLISRKRNEDTEASKFGKEITSRNHYSFVDPLVSGRSSMQEECPSVSARLARTCMTYGPLAASTLQEEGICAARLIPLSTVGQACFTLASTSRQADSTSCCSGR